MINLKWNALSILFLLVGFDNPSGNYEKLMDFSFDKASIVSSSKLLPKTKYVIFKKYNSFSAVEVEKIIYKTEAALLDYSERNDVKITACRDIETLEIYLVSEEILNDKSRFSNFSNKNLKSTDIIWGAYDPISEYSKHAALIITDQGITKTEETIAHELYHFWYDKSCWDLNREDPEKAALDFEDFYEKNYK